MPQSHRKCKKIATKSWEVRQEIRNQREESRMFVGEDGRNYVNLLKTDNTWKAYAMDHLIAITFVPNNDPSKTKIEHIDGNLRNDCAENLR